MCDEHTDDAEQRALVGKGLSRRQFAAASAAMMAASCTTPGIAAGALREQMVTVPTPDGVADAFWVYPATGTAPAVLLWPDVAGLRDAFKIMARRLAAEGFAVLAVNPYYRNARAPVLESFSDWRTPEGQAKIAPMREALTDARIVNDSQAFVAWLDAQPAVDKLRRVGTQGYCMGGPFAVRTAAANPARVGAAASLHGGGLVTDAPNSPHRLIAASEAAFLIAIARNDDAREPSVKEVLKTSVEQAGRGSEVEVYPADHGWTVIDLPVYDEAAAERAYARILALYARL
ncbi:dienelactone hydrolase family protein [Croceicoccus sp. F390]|uniref:Dienelactone hydrolase family protein n=1 Tax=Croceicoccus esteveae TaxID=3075597 RepID=A0ABU2ZK20_9SPHN|nr:dienelactone hydrolase family protein [Croceicoccus sp. F390]MDT0575747.1 dienelactone hydrolase family protein [Croceicoccus sp. F390]